MLNVLQISHDLEFGGLQQVVVNLCKSVNKAMFRLSVLSIHEKGPLSAPLEDDGVVVDSLNINSVDYLTFIKIARHLRKQKWDIIHTHNTQPLLEGGLAALMSSPHTPLIHTDHSHVFPVKTRYRLAERAMSWHAKKVVAVSKSTANDLINKIGMLPSKIQVIPNGVDVSRFQNTPQDFRIIRPVRDREKIIGVVGRLVEGKGIQYLLHAMKILLDGNMNVRLVIVGEGEYKSELDQLACHYEISERIEFAGSRADVEKLYAIFDVFVLPSLSEGLPVVLLEAMASGCPVIASDVGGVGELIKDGVSGMLVPPMNASELAAILQRVLSDDGYRAALARRGLAVVQETFSLQAMARSYEDLYSRYAAHKDNPVHAGSL